MKEQTTPMYDPFKIGHLTVKNRLVRSATFEFGADDGQVTPRIIEHYREVAVGGSGLIVSGMHAVSASGRGGAVMVEASYSQYVADMKRIADVVHEHGSLLFVQLNHAGYKASPADGYDHLGVSAKEVAEGLTYREATPEDIKKIVADFAEAARRCKEAGCDGVQIHSGHGYLFNTFLSPYYNHRTDAYGGPIENRARILFETYDAIRAAVGADFAVTIKIPFSDRVTPSITPDECVFVCRELERKGIDMIEITSGLTMDGGESSFTPVVRDESQEASFLPGAVQVAEAVKVPVISVCGYRTPAIIEKALTETPVAAIALCRPLIREPDLPNRWKTDPSKATCISCNKCFTSKGIIACQVKK